MQPNTISSKEPNYFIRLFQGKIPLAMTFWVWFVFLNFILQVIAGFFIGEYGLEVSEEQRQRGIIVFIVINLYLCFIIIALWRSASNHEEKLWANIVKIITIFILYSLFTSVYSTVRVLVDKEFELVQGIKNMKERLPFKVNEELLITYADIDTKHITYHYQYTKFDITQQNFEEQNTKSSVERSLCQNKETASLIQNNYSFHYSYYDKNRELIMKTIIDKKNCNIFQENEKALKQILNNPMGSSKTTQSL